MKASAIIIGWEGSSAELSAILDRMRPAANGDFFLNDKSSESEKRVVRQPLENEALKGVLSSLTRNAKKITGYENVRVVEPGSDGRSYTLADPLLSFIRSEMDKNG
jgi:hypothetical protein